MTSKPLSAVVEEQRLHLCKDCRWCAPSTIHEERMKFAKCTEPRAAVRNPVSGEMEPEYCSIERDWKINLGCGKQGKYWQSKGGEDRSAA